MCHMYLVYSYFGTEIYYHNRLSFIILLHILHFVFVRMTHGSLEL